jgi:hypothetical protein
MWHVLLQPASELPPLELASKYIYPGLVEISLHPATLRSLALRKTISTKMIMSQFFEVLPDGQPSRSLEIAELLTKPCKATRAQQNYLDSVLEIHRPHSWDSRDVIAFASDAPIQKEMKAGDQNFKVHFESLTSRAHQSSWMPSNY